MTSVSKNVYNDKLDDIVDKYNTIKIKMNKYNTIKMKPVIVKSSSYIDSSKENSENLLKLKLVILLEYQNIKIFFQKTSLRHGHMLLLILMEKKLLEHSMKKNFKK